VLTVSVHADPAHYYPFFWGYAHQRGAGAGIGANLNLPLPLGGEDPSWLAAITAGLAAVSGFAAEALVLALGLDAHEADPLQGLKVSFDGYREAGRRVRALGLPTVIIQEGGYLQPSLGTTLQSFLTGFLEGA
jgi:acetoin utilization deacetylase AcuC-like enzyme